MKQLSIDTNYIPATNSLTWAKGLNEWHARTEIKIKLWDLYVWSGMDGRSLGIVNTSLLALWLQIHNCMYMVLTSQAMWLGPMDLSQGCICINWKGRLCLWTNKRNFFLVLSNRQTYLQEENFWEKEPSIPDLNYLITVIWKVN